jgi:hypothetical protein
MTDFFSILDDLNNENQETEMLDGLTVVGTVWLGAGCEGQIALNCAFTAVDEYCHYYIIPYGSSRCKSDTELLEFLRHLTRRNFTPTFFVLIDTGHQNIWLRDRLSELFPSFTHLHGAVHLPLLEQTTSSEREEIIDICKSKHQTQLHKES